MLVTIASIIALIGSLWLLLSVMQKASVICVCFKVIIQVIGLLIKLIIKRDEALISLIKDIHEKLIKHNDSKQA